MNIIFAGTPDFAAAALSAIAQAGFNISLVLTQPDGWTDPVATNNRVQLRL